MKAIIERYYKEFIIAILVIVIIVLGVLLVLKKEKRIQEPTINEISYTSNNEEKEEIQEKVKTKIKVDIKGAVVKPGVYELDVNSVVNDAIKLAGGLKKSADTSNINLSKELENEMVIKIFTTNEIKKLNKEKEVVTTPDNTCSENTIIIDKCNNSSIIKDTSTSNSADSSLNTDKNAEEVDSDIKEASPSKLISINTATIEEFVTLPGIGESKAESIIKYREEHGSFKTIEEIKSVSGIGEAAYNKIKEFITI